MALLTATDLTIYSQAQQKMLIKSMFRVAEDLKKTVADLKTRKILIEAALQCSTTEQVDRNDLKALAESLLAESN